MTAAELRQRIGAYSALLEYHLRDMEGPAAAHMRFEQLGSYSLKHAQEEFKRIDDGVATGILPASIAPTLCMGVTRRRNAAWAFQPLGGINWVPSPEAEALCPQIDYWGYPAQRQKVSLSVDMISFRADESYWERQRLQRPGIPCRRSRDFRRRIWDALAASRVTKGKGTPGSVKAVNDH